MGLPPLSIPFSCTPSWSRLFSTSWIISSHLSTLPNKTTFVIRPDGLEAAYMYESTCLYVLRHN